MPVLGNRVWETTNTTGAGTAFTLLGCPDATQYRTVAQEVANGAVFYYCRYSTNPLVYEIAYGTFNSGTNAITPTVGVYSTLTPIGGAFVPINWTGTQNVISAPAAQSILLKENNLSDLASASTARTNLGLGTAAVLNVGTAANQIVQMTAAAKLPAVDGSLLTNLPAGTPSVPSGSVTDWYQAAAPSGWTRVTTAGLNDRVPIIVTGGSPGTTNAETWTIDGLDTVGVALTLAQIPSHSHFVGADLLAASGGAANSPVSFGAGTNKDTSSVGGGDPHNHAVSSDGSWRPPALYMLLASKN